MGRVFIFVIFIFMLFSFTSVAQEGFETDIIESSQGNLEITFIGHGTLMFTFGEKVIHVDPWSRLADYSKLPKADLILLTHDHRDHLDPQALEIIRIGKTEVVLTQNCADKGQSGIIMVG